MKIGENEWWIEACWRGVGGGVEAGRDVGGCRCFVHVGRLAEGGVMVKGEMAQGEGMGFRLLRPLCDVTISITTTPITLTLILSQDGRGDKRGGYDGYAKVSIKR